MGNKGVGLHGTEGSGTPEAGCTSHGRCGGTEGADGEEGGRAGCGGRDQQGCTSQTHKCVLENVPLSHGPIIGARPVTNEVRE